MLASSIPAKFQQYWANAAGGSYVRAIPLTSQIGVNNGWASFPDGFPPLNFQPIGSGGVPPFGQDMNGILKQATQTLQWLWAGGAVPYDATFQTAIGGYPLGAVVASATTPGLTWRSTVDNNTTNPDTGGAGWVPSAKIKLSGNITVYVRSDGNDANNGLANTAGGAFQTLQGAWNAIFSLYDTSGFTITIQIGLAGTYAGVAINGNSGTVIINGNSGSPGSYIINCNASHQVIVNTSANLTVQNCTLLFNDAIGSALGAIVDAVGAPVTVGPNVTTSVTNNCTGLYEFYATGSGGSITLANNSTLTVGGAGSRAGFAYARSNASILLGNAPGVTVTLTSTATIAYANFIVGLLNSSQDWSSAVFTSFTMTGVQWDLFLNASLNLSGVTIPGSAGVTTYGGQVKP